MTQENKDLLLKDLCARLPYGVKAYIKKWSKLDQKYYEGVYTVVSIDPSLNDIYASAENGSVEVILGHTDYFIKPYLFPLSSMTEEQRVEAFALLNNCDYYTIDNTIKWLDNHPIKFFDWCNKNHFDYLDLIPMGHAIDATGLNIY